MDTKYINHFREIIRIFDREIFLQNNAACCNGISVAQCHTLLEIEKKREISVSEIAGNLSLDKSTISRTVDNLVANGLINRIIPEENRRKAIISLTSRGKEACATINYSNDTYIKKVLHNFTPEEQDEFLRLFKKLTCNMVDTRVDENCC